MMTKQVGILAVPVDGRGHTVVRRQPEELSIMKNDPLFPSAQERADFENFDPTAEQTEAGPVLGEEAREFNHPDGMDEQHRPLYLLCYFQPDDGRIVGCDRVRGHLGPHSWETDSLVAAARAAGEQAERERIATALEARAEFGLCQWVRDEGQRQARITRSTP